MAVVIPLKAPLPPRRGSPGPPHAREAATEALPTPVWVEIEAFSSPGRTHPFTRELWPQGAVPGLENPAAPGITLQGARASPRCAPLREAVVQPRGSYVTVKDGAGKEKNG